MVDIMYEISSSVRKGLNRGEKYQNEKEKHSN